MINEHLIPLGKKIFEENIDSYFVAIQKDQE